MAVVLIENKLDLNQENNPINNLTNIIKFFNFKLGCVRIVGSNILCSCK